VRTWALIREFVSELFRGGYRRCTWDGKWTTVTPYYESGWPFCEPGCASKYFDARLLQRVREAGGA
jgi:hypothetical protein